MTREDTNAKLLSIEEMSQYYQYPVDIACLYLKVSKKCLKNNLSRLGIAKWPYHYSVHGTNLQDGKNINFYEPKSAESKELKKSRKTQKPQRIEKPQKMEKEKDLKTLTNNLGEDIKENHLKKLNTNQSSPSNKSMTKKNTTSKELQTPEEVKLPSFQEFLDNINHETQN